DWWDKTVILWEIASGKEVRRFSEQGEKEDGFTRVLFSPDSKFLLAGFGRSVIRAGDAPDMPICCWDIATGKEVKRFEGHKIYVASFVFSNDGKTLFSGGFDKTIRIWDVATAKEVRVLAKDIDGLWSIALSPDGKTVAAPGSGSLIRLWDVKTG